MLPVRHILRRLSTCHVTTCQTIPIKQSPTRAMHVTCICYGSKSKKSSGSQKQESGSDVDNVMKKAAKDVADTLPGDAEKTAAELLAQLRVYDSSTQSAEPGMSSSKPVPSLGDLFSGMKIETGETAGDNQRGPLKSIRRDGKYGHKEEHIEGHGLFEGPRLNIFHTSAYKRKSDLQITGETLWDVMDREELRQLKNTPPTNAFEEMIQLTEEGKLWHFPINNEQGMDEEAKYEFHDHIFFDDLLEDFPKKGPVRHFMELVTTGLSKNPYMTVPQKREHIEWFKNYFQDKQHIIDEATDTSKTQ